MFALVALAHGNRRRDTRSGPPQALEDDGRGCGRNLAVGPASASSPGNDPDQRLGLVAVLAIADQRPARLMAGLRQLAPNFLPPGDWRHALGLLRLSAAGPDSLLFGAVTPTWPWPCPSRPGSASK